MDPSSLLRRDPAGVGTALGLLLALAFAAAPVAAPLLLALAVVATNRFDIDGLAVGALVGLAAAKGLVEVAGLSPREGFTGTPWLVAVSLGLWLLAASAIRRNLARS